MQGEPGSELPAPSASAHPCAAPTLALTALPSDLPCFLPPAAPDTPSASAFLGVERLQAELGPRRVRRHRFPPHHRPIRVAPRCGAHEQVGSFQDPGELRGTERGERGSGRRREGEASGGARRPEGAA